MLILGTYIFAKGRLAFCTAAAVPGSHKNTVHRSCTGNQGPPLALYSSLLGLQATFLLFQNFERVQQTSSHLFGLANLKMLGAGQNVWQQQTILTLFACSRLYYDWKPGAFANCSWIDRLPAKRFILHF